MYGFLYQSNLRMRSNALFLGMNCEKNAVVCEGYHEKQIWKSGKEKAEEGEYLDRSTNSFC